MAAATVPRQYQVHGPRTSIIGSARYRCQNVAGCEVHAAGAIAHATDVMRDHSENTMPARSTSNGIQRVPKRKRKSKAGVSITSTVGIETHMEQIHLQSPQSQNSPHRPSTKVWPTEGNTIPSNRRENVDSAQERVCLLGRSKHQEINNAGQGHGIRAPRDDFVLFDGVSPRQLALDHLDNGCPEDDDNAIIESLESAEMTEWNVEDTPHLHLPPRPRPTRLPTPDFDDEISLTFFPPLDTMVDKRKSRPAIGECEDTMPLLFPLSDGTLDQPQF